MAKEKEQLIEAALALDGSLPRKPSSPPLAGGDLPADLTDLPDERKLGAARFVPKPKQG